MLLAGSLRAEMRFPPPEFDNGYLIPTAQHPLPRALWHEYLDVAVLALALGTAGWAVYRKRSRNWIMALAGFSLLYFGFYREGCVCAIGSVQNVALGLFTGDYAVPAVVLAFFALPLIAALFFGRLFCASVCPHGALQDLVLLKPVKIPSWLERGLGLVPFVYLGLAILVAGTGSAFIICRYDPFIPIFRLSGSLGAVLLGGGFLAAGLFIGRPYCRFLCPYGALLRMASAVAKWRVRITPNSCTQCQLCAEACPFGVIREPSCAAGLSPRVLAAGRRSVAWSLLALLLLVTLGGWAGSHFGNVAAGLNPDVRLARMYSDFSAGNQNATLDKADELALARAQQNATGIAAAAQIARKRFHFGGWIFGGWVGLVAGMRLLGLSAGVRHAEFEPERAGCFACGRCFEYCPQDRTQRGASGTDVSPARLPLPASDVPMAGGTPAPLLNGQTRAAISDSNRAN